MIIAIDLRPLTGGNISGVEIYISNLIDHLLEKDKSNTYVFYINSFKDQKEILNRFNGANAVKIQTHIPNKLFNLSLAIFRYPKLDQVIQKKTGLNPDIYFIPDLRPTPLSKKTHKITTIHDLAYKHFPHYYSLKSRIWYKYINPKREILESNRIIAVSNHTKDDLIKTYKINSYKISVIHEGVCENFGLNLTSDQLNQIKKKYNLPKKYFLFLATLEPRKNIHNLIKAFKIYKKNKGKYHLLICGKINKEIFNNMEIPKDKHIQLTGFVDEKDKPGIYTLSEAFIYPSFFEGFGLPLLEAMKCQTPIITSNTSSMPEVVGNSAILIDPKSPDEIAEAMNKIQNPLTKGLLIKKMNQRIHIFSWKNCAIKTLKLFKTTFHERYNP